MPNLHFNTPFGRLGGYLARPIGSGARPGIVVIQDALGLTDDIREQADRLATAGYVAFAPDLFSGRGMRCVVAALVSSRTGRGQGYVEIAAARRFLAEQPECNGRIGIIGFCMGGGFALMSAPSGEYAAASVNYGEVPRHASERLAGTCPVVGSYGARDRVTPARAARLEAALTELGVTHDVKEYEHAGHGFLNRFNTGPLLTPLLRFIGLGYEHDAAEDTWRRILEFFAAHVGSGDPGAAEALPG